MKTAIKNNWLTFLIFILIPLATGGLSAFISMPSGSLGLYRLLEKPPFSPPGWLFPVVWSFLYLLMGISSYIIYKSSSERKADALFHYGVQLFVNFFWPFLFFRFLAFFSAFVWLIFLWILIFNMILQFKKISRIAALLQIPYLIWVSFAGYLNLGIYLLNK